MEHNYDNCHNINCRRKCENLGKLLAYQFVKEDIGTIKTELSRKGIEEPNGFSVLSGFIDNNIEHLKRKFKL